MNTQHLVRKILLSMLFSVFSISHASWLTQAHSTGGLIEQDLVEREQKAKESGDETILRLVQYRNSIEKDAYKTTMQLCIGYQAARGVEVPMYHKKYTYSKEGAVSSWVDIFNHGLRQPFSSIGGIKADYIEAKNISILSLDYWLQSLYVMYLIRSDGFLQASVHCLNTIDHDEIFYFALAIARVDAQATALAEVGLLLSGEAVISLILKSSKWVFRPVVQLAKVLTGRMTRTHWKVGGIIVIPIVVDNFIVHMKNLKNQQQAMDQLVANLVNPSEELSRSQRLILVKGAFDLLAKALGEHTTEDAALNAQELKTYLKTHFDPKQIAKCIHDYQDLKRKNSTLETDLLYLSLLDIMLPIIIENSNK